MIGTILAFLLLSFAIPAASLWMTRKITDEAYFHKRLAHGRLPWIAHIPTYALIVSGVLRIITALTGFPLNLDASTFMGRNLYGIYTLALTLGSALSALAVITIVGVPTLLWFYTQRVPERRRSNADILRRSQRRSPGLALPRPRRFSLRRRSRHPQQPSEADQRAEENGDEHQS